MYKNNLVMDPFVYTYVTILYFIPEGYFSFLLCSVEFFSTLFTLRIKLFLNITFCEKYV